MLVQVQGPESEPEPEPGQGQGPGLDEAAAGATVGTEGQVEPASNENSDLHKANRSSRAKTL